MLENGNGEGFPIKKKSNLSHETSSVPFCELCRESFKNAQYSGTILSI